jgi:hypothetical protein
MIKFFFNPFPNKLQARWNWGLADQNRKKNTKKKKGTTK